MKVRNPGPTGIGPPPESQRHQLLDPPTIQIDCRDRDFDHHLDPKSFHLWARFWGTQHTATKTAWEF